MSKKEDTTPPWVRVFISTLSSIFWVGLFNGIILICYDQVLGLTTSMIFLGVLSFLGIFWEWGSNQLLTTALVSLFCFATLLTDNPGVSLENLKFMWAAATFTFMIVELITGGDNSE